MPEEEPFSDNYLWLSDKHLGGKCEGTDVHNLEVSWKTGETKKIQAQLQEAQTMLFKTHSLLLSENKKVLQVKGGSRDSIYYLFAFNKTMWMH